MSHYGYEIVQTLIVDFEPDVHVKRAMNEINTVLRLDIDLFCSFSLSSSEREAASEKAEAGKILQIKRAEGEAESKYLSGLGIARTSSEDVMDMVLVTRYFDTLKDIGASSKSNSVKRRLSDKGLVVNYDG
ncbi:unnamed protein product [Eruca vesicaria subsp. sativa]|uniref:Uncharacterized protein n=1 Tax=Eruca vesicaria subsp. sativa TaxID=29727 RepID=A0ABC8J4J5_ERUVS|nr:unnamed protein product [Eruca vesicaria subsp. sativa]